MKNKIKNILLFITLILLLISIFVYTSYIHKNELHWMEVKYIKIIK